MQVSVATIKASTASQFESIRNTVTSFNEKIYTIYFTAIKGFVDLTTRHKCRPLGLIAGTILLETPGTCKAIYRRLAYRNDPTTYGFNQFQADDKGKTPALLVHGRMGKWTDMVSLAHDLKKAQIPVFVINLKKAGLPTETDRAWINSEIARIQNLYTETFKTAAPKVDLVGHSLGGDMALYTSFTTECSSIEEMDEKTLGDLKMKEGFKPTANPLVGKVITIGMPSNKEEVAWAKSAGKLNQLFNITAKYDAIVVKECALKTVLPQNTYEVNCGHLSAMDGASDLVVRWLSQ